MVNLVYLGTYGNYPILIHSVIFLGPLQNHSRVILDLSTVYGSRLMVNCMHQALKMELYACGRRLLVRHMVYGSV